MYRTAATVVIGVLALASGPACGGPKDAPSAAPAPTAPGAPVHVSHPDLQVPGYQVVVVNAMDGGPAHGELRQGDTVLTGAQAFLVAREAMGGSDAGTLARLAAVFVDPAGADSQPWKTGDPVLGDGAGQAPSISGEQLTYVRAHRQRPVMVSVSVDLGTGEVSVAEQGAGVVAPAGQSAVLQAARDALAGDNVDAARAALGAVARSKDPGAGAFLAEFLSSESRMFLRKAVVDAIAASQTPGGDAALAVALAGDANVDVRRAAARGLELWPRPEAAVPALRKAATDDQDAAVRAIASRIVAKLP